MPDAGRSEAGHGGCNESFSLIVGAFKTHIDPVELKLPFRSNLIGYDVLRDDCFIKPARELENAGSGGRCGSGLGIRVSCLANAGSFRFEHPVVGSEICADSDFKSLCLRLIQDLVTCIK